MGLWVGDPAVLPQKLYVYPKLGCGGPAQGRRFGGVKGVVVRDGGGEPCTGSPMGTCRGSPMGTHISVLFPHRGSPGWPVLMGRR